MLIRLLSRLLLVTCLAFAPGASLALSLAEIDGVTLDALTGSSVDSLTSDYDFLPEISGGDGNVTSQVYTGTGAASGGFVYLYQIELYTTPPASVGSIWGMRWDFSEMPVAVDGIGEAFWVGDDGGDVVPFAANWADGMASVVFVPAISNGKLSHTFGFVSPNAPAVTIASLIDSGALGGTAAVLSNGAAPMPEPSAALIFGLGLLIVAPAVSRARS